MTHAQRRPATGRPALADLPAADGDGGAWIAARRPLRRRLHPTWRLGALLSWTMLCSLAQAVVLLLPGRPTAVVTRAYWGGMCAILGLRLRVIGAPAHATADGRPVVYVSNHSSWLDILVLGSRLDAAFIAKEEVGTWPVIGWIARLGRTVYVRRARTSTGRERDEMRARLASGDNLILFPEGTTSDGARVLPFRSAFLSIAELPTTPDGKPPIVQPVSVVYDRLAGLPAGRATRPIFSWYGDMDIASHYWQLAGRGAMRVSVLLHPPLDPRDFPNRKALTLAVWQASAEGAAVLRQNRPPPLGPAPATALV